MNIFIFLVATAIPEYVRRPKVSAMKALPDEGIKWIVQCSTIYRGAFEVNFELLLSDIVDDSTIWYR
jgi:hypothetical protein